MFTSLKGRSVVVTGASKGIGRGIAQRFGQAGCHEILAAGGGAKAFAADVTRQADMHAMVAAAVESFGTIDILCANAGIFPAAKLGIMSRTTIRSKGWSACTAPPRGSKTRLIPRRVACCHRRPRSSAIC